MLAFEDYYDTFEAAQYTGSNVADIRTFIETVTYAGSTSMADTVIVNPVSAVHVGDWIRKDGQSFVVVDDPTFQASCRLSS